MKEKIILKSLNPNEYPDLIVECKVIKNSEIREYIADISEEKKFSAYKSAKITARIGKLGEKIVTKVKTIINNKEYILSELTSTVKEEEIKTSQGIVKRIGFVVKNINSTSSEEYIVKPSTFIKSYILDQETKTYTPVYDLREFAQVDENIIFETSWGEYVVCLAGSYLVTYNAEENDYNAVEKSAFEKTYTQVDKIKRKLKR